MVDSGGRDRPGTFATSHRVNEGLGEGRMVGRTGIKMR